MDPLDVALLVVMAASVAGLIHAERAGARGRMWVFKPLASACFVALGWPIEEPWMFDALVLAFLGDLCLVPADKRIFRVGIILFLLAHLAFIAAFFAMGIDTMRSLLALVPLGIAATFIGQWLVPQAPRELRAAVVAYMLVITAMVALAVGTLDPWLIGAALAFWANDLLLARDRFVKRWWVHRLVGLPLYYGSMAIFALAASGYAFSVSP